MVDKDKETNQGEVIIYQSENGDAKIDVRFVDETVWLIQQQMAELFQYSHTNIVEPIQHIYEKENWTRIQSVGNCDRFVLRAIGIYLERFLGTSGVSTGSRFLCQKRGL